MSNPQYWANLDKFLLSGFVLYFSLFAFLAIYGTPAANPFVAAMLDNEKTMIGALLGLITGRALARQEDRNPQPAKNP